MTWGQHARRQMGSPSPASGRSRTLPSSDLTVFYKLTNNWQDLPGADARLVKQNALTDGKVRLLQLLAFFNRRTAMPQAARAQLAETMPPDSHEDTRTAMSGATIRRAFLDHVFYTQGKLPGLASPNDLYQALAHTVRDRLVQRWISTAET